MGFYLGFVLDFEKVSNELELLQQIESDYRFKNLSSKQKCIGKTSLLEGPINLANALEDYLIFGKTKNFIFCSS